MPATLVEDQEDLEGKEPVDTLAGAAITDPTVTPTKDPEDDLEDTVPDKYKGKTARELLDIINNQESMIGRHGQELGDLRSQNGTLRGLVDQSLALRESGNLGRPDAEEAALQDDDFTLNPLDATQRTVAAATKPLQAKVNALEAGARSQQFLNDFPDAKTDLKEQAFIDFVQGSTSRKALAAKAFADPRNIDYNSAQDLWERYNDFKSMTTGVPIVKEGDGDDDTAADADKTSSAPDKTDAPDLLTGTSGGETGQAASGKPKYSQAALNALQLKDPELFWRDDTQKRIEAARKEGRILQDG